MEDDYEVIENPVSAFHQAAINGDVEKLTELLENERVGINDRDADGNTALHLACFHGQTEVINILLENGIDSTLKNKSGFSAIAEGLKIGGKIDSDTTTIIHEHGNRIRGERWQERKINAWNHVEYEVQKPSPVGVAEHEAALVVKQRGNLK